MISKASYGCADTLATCHQAGASLAGYTPIVIIATYAEVGTIYTSEAVGKLLVVAMVTV